METSADQTTTEKPRTINELIDLPYSEMTEEEIALVVEFKADVKARDAEHEARMEALHEGIQESVAFHRATAESAQATLEALTSHALERLEIEG